MKIFSILQSFLIIICVETAAQHQLVGTWEMVSIKGINAEGERFTADTSSVREVKVITPTHYMLMAYDVAGDSLVFNRCYAGSVEIGDKKYNEFPLLSSAPIFENVKTDYTWKVEGDKFIQSGTFIRPDGKKIVLEELVFRRVKTPQAYPDNRTNGTWKLLSSDYTTADGSKHSDTNQNVDALQIITPTHWMFVSSRDKKFEHAMGGTYIKEGDKYLPSLDFASFPKKLWGKTQMTEKLQGETLRISGASVFPDGKKFTWEDVFKKVK